MHKKYIKLLVMVETIVFIMTGCGQNSNYESVKNNNAEEQSVIEFEHISETETVPVIIRDTQPAESEEPESEEESSSVQEEVEIIPFVDRGFSGNENSIETEEAQNNEIEYDIQTAVYEAENVKISYPQLAGMKDEKLQSDINENIKKTVLNYNNDSEIEYSFYEIDFETASKGKCIVSFIFRGSSNAKGAAYPLNIIKTLNINLTDGSNLRLKDYADIANVVACLEGTQNYSIKNDGVTSEDFAAFLNNGYVMDYAITLLDYDVDFANMDMVLSGYSAIRDNHLVLFIEAEHAMGDYVELVFDEDL